MPFQQRIGNKEVGKMKNLDFKMRQRFEKREYEGITRLEKKAIKKAEADKKQGYSQTEDFCEAVKTLNMTIDDLYGKNAPIVHGAMKYHCKECGNSWFMCLEIGVEDHGENGRPHQPCPFCIPCACGGVAQDISGYIPLGANAKLQKGMSYFAYDDSGNELACGKATVYY